MGWRAGITLMCGVGLLGGGLAWAARNLRLLRDGLTLPETVVELEPENLEDETYRPLVRFRTRSGLELRFRSSVSHPRAAGYHVGQRVRVVYDPADPQATASIRGDLWQWPVLFGFLGGLFLWAYLAIEGG
jgi:hypothetical protein